MHGERATVNGIKMSRLYSSTENVRERGAFDACARGLRLLTAAGLVVVEIYAWRDCVCDRKGQ